MPGSVFFIHSLVVGKAEKLIPQTIIGLVLVFIKPFG